MILIKNKNKNKNKNKRPTRQLTGTVSRTILQHGPATLKDFCIVRGTKN